MEDLKPRPANSSPMTPIGFLDRAATIHRGQVVSVIAPNTPPMYELHFAVPMAGAVLITINLRLDARTISILLRHSESKLIFVDQASSSLISDALALFPPEIKPPPLVLIPEGTSVEQSLSSSSTISISGNFVNSYEEMIRKGDSEFRWIQPTSEWDPIVEFDSLIFMIQ